MLIICFIGKSFPQIHGTIAGSFLTPDNIRYVATTLHPTANIKSRLIHFSAGDDNDLLLEFPLGPQDPRNAYTITIALKNSYYNKKGVDADLVVGISDGTNSHLQLLVDANDYATHPPCRPINGSHDNNLVPPGTKVPPTITLSFVPFFKYATCETGQNGGYLNTGTFNTKLDTDKQLFLRVFRHNGSEEVHLRYIKIEDFV